MTTIDLMYFFTKDKNEIYRFLLNANDHEFNIITYSYRDLTIKGTSYWSDFLGMEYYDACYIGHELFLIADTFAVYIPDPNVVESIRFEITTTDMLVLTEYLDYFLKGAHLVPVNHPEKQIDFQEMKDQFHEDMLIEKSTPYNSFIAIAGVWVNYNNWCINNS